MADRIVSLNGVEHHFPDTFTDEQVSTALKGYHASEPAAAPKSFLGRLNDAIKPVSQEDIQHGLWQGHVASPATEKFVTTPLLHPTGIDAIDGFTSPAGLVTLASGAAAHVAGSPSARAATAKGLRVVGDFDFKQPFKSTVGALADRLDSSAQPAATSAPQPAAAETSLADQVRAAGLDPSKIISSAPGAQPRATSMLTGRLVRTGEARPPITVAPESPMQPPSPLQQPRVAVGAEVVGRQNGLSKEAVRQQTGPLFNEAPGAASPVVPQTPFERMHDKLLAMGHGNPAREAYVQAAKDPKTAGQLEILRRTLERNGLSIAAAGSMAEAMRQAVMKRLQGEQP